MPADGAAPLRADIIVEYIQKLIPSLDGVHPLVSSLESKKLDDLYKKKDFEGMVRRVAEILKLSLQIRVETACFLGPLKGAMWIDMPLRVPLCGKRDFTITKATVYFRQSFLDCAPFETIVFGIAHELSHVVLRSIDHELKSDEIAVDLTAMMLGFRNFYLAGHAYTRIKKMWRILNIPRAVRLWLEKVYGVYDIEVVKVGYLTAREIRYAAVLMCEIEKIQNKYKNN